MTNNLESITEEEALQVLEAFRKKYRPSLQMYRTMKGQIKSGNIKGAMIGMERIIEKQRTA